MRRALIWISLGLVLTLVGCGQRQAVKSASGKALVKDIPNDSGGYAKDLADPPAEQSKVNIEGNVKAGATTDSRDPVREPDAEDTKKADDHKKADDDKPKTDPNQPAKKDTSGDTRWQSSTNPVVAMQTTKGVVYLELWPSVAPKHVANLLKLAKAKFYDGIFVHRVEPGFVMQAGDPITKKVGPKGPGVGSGGPGWTVAHEFSSKPHVKGTLSMARTQDPDSAGSQFFICLGRAEPLDGKYSVFGRVLGEGMDTVDKIEVGDQIQFMWVVKQ